MAPNPSRTTLSRQADTVSNVVTHRAVQGEIGECAFYTVPQFASYVCSDDPSGELPSETEAVCDFPDGSYALYAMYDEMTAEFDKELVD